MARIQLALNVTDLDASVEFYTRLLGVEPAKLEPGYANFAVAHPPLKLVLFEGGDDGTINHLGVEVDTTDEVDAAQRRLSGEGVELTEERDTECCYARQDKVWITAPGGVNWEIYTVLEDVPAEESSAECACS